MDGEEMDSLFEGMVLFTPSQFADHDHRQNPNTVSTSLSLSSDDSTTQTTTSQLQQQPLDENLFSDLTLVTQLEALTEQSDPNPDSSFSSLSASTSTPPPTTTAISISRQISRKKKRAAGLRVGYGRDTSSHFDDDDADDDAPVGNHLPPSQSEDALVISGLELIKAEIFEKLSRARQLAASVSASRKDSIRMKRLAADSLHSASTKHSDLEKQLEEACEAEDFEAAERISESLAAADKERQALLISLRDAESYCDAIDSNMQEVLNSQIAVEEECAFLLHRFSTDTENNADLLLKKAEALYSEEMENWLSATEAVEVKKIELEIESNIVNEARFAFSNSIEGSVEDDSREKEFLCEKKDMLTNELQKLLVLVKEKEKEIQENDLKIKAVNERIADVVSGFGEVQSSIDAKYDGLQSGLYQMDIESEALSRKKKQIDEFLTAEEDRGAKLRELSRVSADEAKAYDEVVVMRKSLMSSILKSREDRLRLAKTEQKLSEDVQMLQQEVSTARVSLQELSSTKSSSQQNIASFKQKIFFIDKRIPELEAEKKVAAAARNFKEAARLAAEAKSLSLDKDNIHMEMEKAVSELEKVDGEIKDTVNRLQESEGLILSKEKEVAIARFKRLLIISGAAKAERAAALELGDVEEANLLRAEAEAADSEAKKLQPTCNFKQEEFEPKHLISMDLVTNLGRKQLAELAESVNLSAT